MPSRQINDFFHPTSSVITNEGLTLTIVLPVGQINVNKQSKQRTRMFVSGQTWLQCPGTDPLTCTKDEIRPKSNRLVTSASAKICSVSTSFATSPLKLAPRFRNLSQRYKYNHFTIFCSCSLGQHRKYWIVYLVPAYLFDLLAMSVSRTGDP